MTWNETEDEIGISSEAIRNMTYTNDVEFLIDSLKGFREQ